MMAVRAVLHPSFEMHHCERIFLAIGQARRLRELDGGVLVGAQMRLRRANEDYCVRRREAGTAGVCRAGHSE